MSPAAGDAGTGRAGRSVIGAASFILFSLVANAFIGASSHSIATTCFCDWMFLWSMRYFRNDRTAGADLLLFAVIFASGKHAFVTEIFRQFSRYPFSAVTAFSMLLVVPVAWHGLFNKSQDMNEADHTGGSGSFGNHCEPLLFPCRTTHTRFFPQKHSFSYSYLLVGIPVGPTKRYRHYGSLVSVDTNLLPAGKNKRGWFHVQGSDFLDRGGANSDLKAKLSQYLRSQGVYDPAWHHAYLVTAPRFLGYSFNPVSFWYIYSETHTLLMMILEVNNTFDERRMYLLKAPEGNQDNTSTSKSAESDANEKPNGEAKFTNSWAKDFHVSPFNSRKGSYSLTAIDPFDISRNAKPRVDNNIVLRSSEGHPKLVARVFSQASPVDPTFISGLDMMRFIGSWWWVGLVTFPRILKEAYKLYFQRSLQVFFRPEVAPTTISRSATDIEISLESFFQKYLRHVVSQADDPIHVFYMPAPGTGEPQELVSPSAKAGEAVEQLEIRVLTPAFYSRFVHYAHTSEAFDRESIFTDEKNRTIWVSKPELLRHLPIQHRQNNKHQAVGTRIFFESLEWDLLKRLRCPPASASYANAGNSNPAVVCEDIRPRTFSPLDEHVQENYSDTWTYRRCLLKLFVAQRYAAGFTEVIDLLDLIFRICLVHAAFAIVCSGPRSASNPVTESIEVVAFNAVHLWALIKGS